MKRPYFVGICGPSASGKSYLLKKLTEAMPEDKIALVSQDNYYKELENQIKDEKGLVNFDHPDSLYLDQFLEDLQSLSAGQTIRRQEYTFNNPAVVPKEIVVEPAPIIIVEGLFVYYLKEMRDLLDLKLFIETEEHVRLERRLKRDTKERGYSMVSILRDYRMFVAPMYRQYIEPLKLQCDLIIPNNHSHSLRQSIAVLTDHLKAKL
jgi:uridine kinase